MSPKDETHYKKAVARTVAAIATVISAALGFFAFKKPLEDHLSKLQTSTVPDVSTAPTSKPSTNFQQLSSPAATHKTKQDDRDDDHDDRDDDDDDDHKRGNKRDD